MTDINEKKQLSDKQKRIASLAGSVTKIDALDFKHLRKHGMKSAQKKKKIAEAIGAKDKQDEGEYGYEGDMAMSQLRTIIRNSEEMMKVLDKKTDLPEWVQSKITLATDYLQTANDYLMSELEEEIELTLEEFEQIDEVDMGQADSTLRVKRMGHGSYHVVNTKTGNVVSKHLHQGDAIRSVMKHGIDDHEVKPVKVMEEVEQIDELSKDTLKSYVKKAVPDMQNSQKRAEGSLAKSNSELDKGNESKAKKHYSDAEAAHERTQKRMAGIAGAIRRVKANEEVEELDELSKGTLGRYIKAANSTDRGSTRSAYEAGKTYGKDGNSKYNRIVTARANKRMKGINKATDKLLAKEEVENLDEALIQQHGLTSIHKGKDSFTIVHQGNMGNTVDKHVKPNVDKMLGVGAFNHMKKAGKEDGNPDYQYTMKVPTKHFMSWVHGTNEEVERVDELSKKTLGSYVKKASQDLAVTSMKQGYRYGKGEGGGQWTKNDEKEHRIDSYAMKKRGKGLDAAVGKLAKEEVERVDEIAPALVGLAARAAPMIARAAPAIGRTGAALGSKLGTRAGVALASRTGTSAMTAGRIGKQLGSAAGSALARTAATSVAQKLAAARQRQQQQANEDVEISADRKDEKKKGKYLGAKKGKTLTGGRANPIEMHPEIKGQTLRSAN